MRELLRAGAAAVSRALGRARAATRASSTRSSSSRPTAGVRVRQVTPRRSSTRGPAPTRPQGVLALGRAGPEPRHRRPAEPARRVPRRARRRHRPAEPRRGAPGRRDRGRDRRRAATPPQRRAHPGRGEGGGRRGGVPARSRRPPGSRPCSTGRRGPGCGPWASTSGGTADVFALDVADRPLVVVLGAEGRGLAPAHPRAVRPRRRHPDARRDREPQRRDRGRGRLSRDRTPAPSVHAE